MQPIATRVPFLLLSLAVGLPGQITEVALPTQPMTVIDMDLVGPAGPTTFAAVVAAGSAGPALLSAITLTPNTAAQGVYNTNPQLGRALAWDATGQTLLLVDPPSGTWTAFDARIDFLLPSTEFGVAIADWVGTMIFDFSFQGVPVGNHTSTSYSSPNAKVFHSVLPFDSVSFRASTTGGNWVIPELHIQNGYSWQPYGSGCPGTSGTPWLTNLSAPQSGTSFQLKAGGVPAASPAVFFATGFSSTSGPTGPLPFSLTPFGAPGCSVLADPVAVLFVPPSAGAASMAWALPAGPAHVGLSFYNQAFVFDAGANQLGLTVTNGGAGSIR